MNTVFARKVCSLGLLGALLSFTIFQGMPSQAQAHQPDTGVPSSQNLKHKAYTKSINFVLGDVTFTLKNLQWQHQAYKNGFAPPKGYQYLAFDLGLKNEGSKDVAITTVSMFQLQDEQENAYPLTLPEEPQNANGPLKPDNQSQGTVRFTVPKIGYYELVVMNPKNTDQIARIKIQKDGFQLAGIERSLESDAAEHGKSTLLQAEGEMAVRFQSQKTPVTRVGELVFEIQSAKKVTKNRVHYVVLNMRVLNKSKVQQALTATNNFELSDSNGNCYEVEVPEPKQSLNGTIEPNHELCGQLIFKVDNVQNQYDLSIML